MPEKKKRTTALMGVGLYFFLAAGASDAIPPEELRASHQKMLQILKDIAESSAEEHPYLGEARARRFRAQLEALPADVPASHRSPLFFQLGIAELYLGNERQAIDHLTRAYDLFVGAQKSASRAAGELEFRLGLAYLRLGETQNCCLRFTPESCILPIRDGGIHKVEEGSRKAIEYFERALQNTPEGARMHLGTRWLLNIAYMTLGEHPDALPAAYLIPEEAFESEEAFPRLANIAPRLGLNTFSNSGGVVADDFDNDGYLDLMVSNWNTSGPLRFFLNQGDGAFAERSEEAGLQGLYGGLNMVQADYDNDGNMDVLVLRGAWSGRKGRHPNSLLRNQGDATFVDVSFAAGLSQVHYPTQTAAWAGGFADVAPERNLVRPTTPMGSNFGDIDNDGYLDFYLGTGDVHYEDLMPNVMYRNQGGQGFADITTAGGVGHLQKGHGIAFVDLDHDGDQDIFEQMGGAYPGDKFNDSLYENPGFGTHWLTVKLVGVRSNRAAIGARIRVDVVEEGESRSIYKDVNSGGTFGANPLRQTIGLGRASRIERLEVLWPTTGEKQVFTQVPLDVFIETVEGGERFTLLAAPKLQAGRMRGACIGSVVASIFARLAPGIAAAFLLFPAAAQVEFVDVTRQVGIDFEHVNGASGRKYFPETMGGGVAFFDFIASGHVLDNIALFDQSTSYEQQNMLLRNQGPDGQGRYHFADVSD